MASNATATGPAAATSPGVAGSRVTRGAPAGGSTAPDRVTYGFCTGLTSIARSVCVLRPAVRAGGLPAVEPWGVVGRPGAVVIAAELVDEPHLRDREAGIEQRLEDRHDCVATFGVDDDLALSRCPSKSQ